MLVLGRKANETIEIDGGRIRITVVDLRGNKVRLGIDAPKDVAVHRGEVQAAIDRQAIVAGDRVCVRHGETWYFARVTDVQGDELRCLLTLDGREWVTTVRRGDVRRAEKGGAA